MAPKGAPLDGPHCKSVSDSQSCATLPKRVFVGVHLTSAGVAESTHHFPEARPALGILAPASDAQPCDSLPKWVVNTIRVRQGGRIFSPLS